MKQAVEITTFKLRTGTFKEFIKANKADIDDWLKKQNGFQSRYILEKKDGTVVDMVFWNTSEQGTEAMSRIINETAHSQVHSMIDQGS
ncbi:MAG TPA: hypothetical protein VK179_02385, partial [Bacteroidales bacterium]|nr:hypothetical protein [Bacteroidales bacterium]